MTLTRPWAIDAAFPNAADQRKQLAAIYPREGVFPDPVTVATAGIAFAGAGWAVSARAFNAVLKRGGVPYSQSYGSALCGNDGGVAAAWTIPGAPVSGSRIDLLCIRARDTTQGDSGAGAPKDGPAGAARTGLPEFLVVQGVAAGSPVAPGLPAGYFEVARATTPSTAVSAAGSTITNTYKFAQLLGGPIVVRTNAERDALVTPLPGERCVVLASGLEYARRGNAWKASDGLISAAAINPGTMLLSTATTAVSGLAITDAPVGVPCLLEIDIVSNNAGSGAQRFIRVQAFNEATGLDAVREFSLPFPQPGGHRFTQNYVVAFTPTAAGINLRLSVDQNSSVELVAAALRLYVAP